MQSSRRKRERSEDCPDDGARGPAQKTKTSHIGDGDGALKTAANDVSPEDDPKTSTGQVQPLQEASDTTEGTKGGDVDSQETTTNGPTAMDTSNEAIDETLIQGSVWEGTGKNTRQERLAALISHRKVLLERMAQCKTAADSRLKRNDEKLKQTVDQKESKGDSQDVAKKGERQTSSDNEEIERYKETCKKAIEASRKQRAQASEASVEKRSSVSLRRGSGVGKRMNDALSSLVPGSGVTSSLPLSDSNASVPTVSGSETFPPAPAMSIQMPMQNSKQAALYASQQRVQPVKSEGMYLPASVKQSSGQQVARKRPASTSQRAAKTYEGSSSFSQGTSLPLHVGAGGSSGLPINRLARPMVDFPEARNLREKRDIIRTKLNALIHERLERIQQTNTADKADADGTAQLKSFAALTEKPSLEEYRLALPRMVLERGVNSPSKLPQRRKTHWDYLLEEMRWLATDFVEERKWKMASGRTVASSIVSNRLNAAALVEKKAENVDGKGEGENSVEEMKESPDEDTEAGPDVVSDLADEAGARKYSHLIPSDVTSVKSTAHIISDMMAEVWMGTMDSSFSAISDEPLMAALARHRKHRMAIKKSEVEAVQSQSVSTEQPVSVEAASEEDKENGSGTMNSEDEEKSASVRETENECEKKSISFTNLSNEDISERIASATVRVKSHHTSRRNRTKSAKEPVSLGAEQRKAADFVELVWDGDDSAAPCLGGPVAAGKTVLSCSLLWKRRSEGPQLVVCPPSRLIRWAYELERFADVNLYVFGMRCGLSSTVPDAEAHSEFRASDVVICEYSSLVQLEQEAQDIALDLSSFSTVIIDARFPTECLRDPSRSNVSSQPAQGKKVLHTPMIPRELVCHPWWASLLESLGSSPAQRLLLDNSECSFLSENECLDGSGLTERQRLDTLAAMASLVVGPDVFSCEKSRSIQHRAVSWAKYSAREGSARKRPLFGEVRGALVDAAFPFRYTIDSEAYRSGDDEDCWEARLCALSISQRSAYEQCCVGVRGSLAFGNITDYADGHNHPEPYQHAVQGLMKLRRVCVHSQVEDVLGKLSVSPPGRCEQSFANVANSVRMVTTTSASVSQPHADIARDILFGSAKLRELVSILHEECGFDVAEGFVMTETELAPEHKSKKKASKNPTKKKVAILAMLPEVQLMASILLNAIGIQHELLGSPCFLNRGNDVRSDSDTRLEKEMYSSRAWIDSQLALLRFNSTLPHTSESDDEGSSGDSVSVRRASCQIVVASPVLVGADNGGLGIEAADLIICLDEDWSGRDTVLLQRISKRCTFAKEMEKPENGKKTESMCNFVRLVCADTCEHVFLSDFNVSMDQYLLTDSRGLTILPSEPEAFSTPMVEKDLQPCTDNVGCHFLFPASSILRFRGKQLSTVLVPTKHIPPAFASGDPVRFLPYKEASTGTSKSTSFELVRSLIAEEDRSLHTYGAHGYFLGDGIASVDLKDSINVNTIPPSPADFPGALMTRHDMMVIASRLYLDRFSRHLYAMGGGGTHEDSTEHRLAGSTRGGPNAFVSSDHGHLTDMWNSGGLSCKPLDLVPTLLSYSADGVGVQSTDDSKNESDVVKQAPRNVQGNGAVVEGEIKPQNSKATEDLPSNELIISTTPRTNLFTTSYCSSRKVVSNVVRDGNQGFEPLPYFPPLFPSLLAASEYAQADIARRSSLRGGFTGPAMASHTLSQNAMLESAPLKRKDPIVAYPSSVASKRPRIEKAPSVVKARHASETAPSAMHAAYFSSASPGTDKNYGSLWTDASVVTEDEGSQWEQSPFLFDMGEDFGLLGIGALSPESYSSHHASMISVGAISYAKWKDPYEAGELDREIYSSTMPCDAEEVETYIRGETDDSFLDTMLLFVANQTPPGFAGISTASASQLGGLNFPGSKPAWQTATSSVLPPPPVAAALVGPDGNVMNGAGGGKKVKRKQSQSGMSIGAFALVNPTDLSGRSMNAYAGTSPQHSSKGRESYRSKVLASILARQGGGRASLFQVPSFLLASIRIRDDVLRRVLSHSQQSSLYPDRRYWTRACFKLGPSTKQTGDSAVQMSKIQSVTMSTAPAPVDFGPFVAGHISSRYAACGATPSSATTGITLPMGVKVPRRSGDKQIKGWLASEDKKLKESVLRYGLNWHLVAMAVNDFDDDSKQHDPERDQPLFRPQPRSLGQCHERWNHLVKLHPEFLQALRNVERSRYNKTVTEPSADEMAGVPCRRITEKYPSGTPSTKDTGTPPLSLVLPSNLFIDKHGDAVMAEEKEKPDVATKGRRKKSFSALRNAAKKNIAVSLPIPGSADGAKPNLVGAHPSHAQTVQTAVVGTSRGKTEMWPLQILDLADKQRAARNPSGSSSGGNSRQPSGPSAAQVRSPGHQPSPNRPPAPFQVPRTMASPSRSPQTNPPHPQGYPAMSVNGSGPVPRAAPFRGPPPPAGKPRASK